MCQSVSRMEDCLRGKRKSYYIRLPEPPGVSPLRSLKGSSPGSPRTVPDSSAILVGSLPDLARLGLILCCPSLTAPRTGGTVRSGPAGLFNTVSEGQLMFQS